MITLRHILCPVDFSVFSHRALQHAVRLARWFGSPLTVLYVYPVPVTPPPVLFDGVPGPFTGEPYPAPAVSADRIHEDMLIELTTFAASVDTSGVQLKFHARAGAVVRGILGEAAEHNADLIVMGTHGHSGFDRWFLGSVTEKILRKAPCAVLTVPPAGESSTDAVAMFKRILCPIDFSESSLKALEYALALSKEADADLLLMHVIEGLGDPPDWQQPTDPAVLEYVRMSKENALTRLRQVIPADAQTWCRPHQILAIGKPHAQILRVVKEEGVHLIVMGVHGRNPIDRLFFGSTTHHLVRASTCPVLTLRA